MADFVTHASITRGAVFRPLPLPLPLYRTVVLHAEHITLLRRILRLRPRSLFPGATTESAASLTLRICGVSAEKEGVALARQELVRPLVRNYCDAELLFREQQPAPSAGGLGSAGFGFGGGSQVNVTFGFGIS